jgi:tetratricopeptide (TPR) repeat protein
MRKYFFLFFFVILLISLAYGDDAATQIEANEGSGARLGKENALISQVESAINAKNWQEAENISKQLIAMNPDRWEYRKALADAEYNLGKQQEALDAYEKAIGMAQKRAGNDFKVATTKVKTAISEMFMRQGNSYNKLGEKNKAIAAYTKAAELSANPGTAYFNICATQYNSGNQEEAIKWCDRVIQIDPNKADAYFIKGSSMFANGDLDQQKKYVVPAGTAETLNKYLELAPTGAHAADVKEMLKMIGSRVTSTYEERGLQKGR